MRVEGRKKKEGRRKKEEGRKRKKEDERGRDVLAPAKPTTLISIPEIYAAYALQFTPHVYQYHPSLLVVYKSVTLYRPRLISQ